MQGDILARTDELVELLGKVHAHFQKEKYLGFLVVTQSCDLVRRGGDCKTSYVSIAVIRSLHPFLDSLFKEFGNEHFPDVCAQERKQSAQQLVERILNQNEWSLGLFYLHPDADAGVAEASVALLRVSIALLDEHYPLLVRARRGRLRPEFSNKLGWLVGNLYSRIATPDWSDSPNPAEFNSLQEELVSKGGRRQWLPKRLIENAIKQNLHAENLAGADAAKRIQQVAPKSSKKLALERVSEIAKGVLGETSKAAIDQIAKRLENDPEFAKACRPN